MLASLLRLLSLSARTTRDEVVSGLKQSLAWLPPPMRDCSLSFFFVSYLTTRFFLPSASTWIAGDSSLAGDSLKPATPEAARLLKCYFYLVSD